MLRSMFGMGGTEILVILIVALLFLGPDKLPEAAKQISKGIRDIKKQSRVLQRTIEDDEHIGGAIRDLKSALRGEDEPVRPTSAKAQIAKAAATIALPAGDASTEATPQPDHPDYAEMDEAARIAHDAEHVAAAEAEARLTMPATAGESDGGGASAADDADLAAMIKPAANTIARGSKAEAVAEARIEAKAEAKLEAASREAVDTEPKHG